MKKLTEEFNTATVKKGDTFQVDLPVGGFIPVMWDVQVVSGKAKLIEKSGGNTGCMPGIEKRVFRAEEAGDIEIVAKEKMGHSLTFKVKVN